MPINFLIFIFFVIALIIFYLIFKYRSDICLEKVETLYKMIHKENENILKKYYNFFHYNNIIYQNINPKQIIIYTYDKKVDTDIVYIKFLYQIKNNYPKFGNQWNNIPITQFNLTAFYENEEENYIIKPVSEIENTKLKIFLEEQNIKNIYIHNLYKKNKPFAFLVLLDPNEKVKEILEIYKEKITKAVLDIL